MRLVSDFVQIYSSAVDCQCSMRNDVIICVCVCYVRESDEDNDVIIVLLANKEVYFNQYLFDYIRK